MRVQKLDTDGLDLSPTNRKIRFSLSIFYLERGLHSAPLKVDTRPFADADVWHVVFDADFCSVWVCAWCG